MSCNRKSSSSLSFVDADIYKKAVRYSCCEEDFGTVRCQITQVEQKRETGLGDRLNYAAARCLITSVLPADSEPIREYIEHRSYINSS